MPASSEGWYIDGVALDTLGRSRVLENRDGWDDTPSVRGENIDLAGQHGLAWRPKKYGPGRKQLAVAIHGTNQDGTVPAEGTAQRAVYEAHLQEMYRLIAARHRPFELMRVHADGSRRVADAEVTAAITPAVVGNSYGQFVLDVDIPGAFFRDVDAETYRLKYKVSGPDTQSLEVWSLQGQTGYCSDSIVTIHGACPSISVQDEASGSGFRYPWPITDSQTLVVDVEGFSATLDGTDVLTSLELFAGDLLEISPAPSPHLGPRVLVSAPGKFGPFSVVLQTRRAWI